MFYLKTGVKGVKKGNKRASGELMERK